MNPAADILIWVLLFAGVGFAALGFTALLIFPDIRSRMYTAVRATIISAGASALAVIIFGLNALLGGGGYQYLTLILHTLLLFCIIVTASLVISGIILEKTRSPEFCTASPETAPAETDEVDRS
jgi:multicomponent Na+:H+ antiporter subunit G